MNNFDVQGFAKAVCHDKRTLEMFRYLVTYAYVRVVNYHHTPAESAGQIDREMRYFSRHFSPVTQADLDIFFQTRKWPKEKPGIIPAVYEGYRSQHEVIWPILERYGMTGWFFIPSFFPDVPAAEQKAYCREHELEGEEDFPDGRVALSWDEVREIGRNHEICCHTGSHFRLTKDSAPEDLRREIVGAKQRLEEQIDRPAEVFCWLWGEEYNYNIRAHRYFEEAGYKYVVSNLKIEKIR